MCTLSIYYLDPNNITVQRPTFEKYTNPSPTIPHQHVHSTLAKIAHLGIDYSPDNFYKMYADMLATTSRVDFKLTMEEISAIKAKVKRYPDAQGKRLSSMDAVLAYFVTVLDRTEDEPIQKIVNVIEVRVIAKRANGHSPFDEVPRCR